MPTPFMHLHVAEQILDTLDRPEEQKRYDGLLPMLNEAWPAFYLGSIAPDYQAICDIPRDDTHFYGMPPEPGNMAYPRMLAQYPQIADAKALPLDQAVFVAAYSAHLMYDLLWFRQILVPYFFDSPDLGSRHQRWLVHHILLTYLDKMAFEALPATAVTTLGSAQPDQWLPFASDFDMIRWRDMLTEQLQPGASIRTIAIYAKRLGMSPDEFAADLADPVWMNDHVFSIIPMEKVMEHLATAVPNSIDLLYKYLVN